MNTSHFKNGARSGSLRKIGMSAASALTYLALVGQSASATPLGPAVTVSLSTTSPKTNDTLTATPLPSGFTSTPTYSYVWKNGATVIPGQNGPTYNLATPGFGDKGNVITCTVTATNGGESASNSAAATVINSAPTVLNVDLPTRLGSALLGRLQVTDDDNDPVTATSANPSITFDNQDYFLYTPTAGGDATVPFTVSDGTATANGTAVFHVAVLAPGTKLYTALGASDVQGYGASDYNYSITGVASQGYAPLVAAGDKLGGTISPLALSRRALNGMSLAAAGTHSIGGVTMASLAASDQAQAYSIWYGPNDVLYELLPLLIQSGLPNQATANGVVSLYMNGPHGTDGWNAGYASLKSSLATASPSAKFAAITVPDFGQSLTALAAARYGLTANQQTYLSTALSSACSQMTTTIKAVIPAAVDVQGNSDLTLPADNSLVFNPGTDLFTDGFHPNSNGYAKLATRLFRQLDKQFNHAPVITTSSLAGGVQGSAYGPVQLTATDADGDSPTWTVGTGLPNGVTLSSAGVLSGTPTATGTFNFTVTADDGKGGVTSKALSLVVLPALTVSNASVLEGNVINATVPLSFTVNLSSTSTSAVTVHYATSDGTGTAGSDYVAASGTLTIAAGQTSGTITVLVNGDTVYEPNETFTLTLSSPTNAGLGTANSATGTITNDDAVPQLSISGLSKAEGNSGTSNYDFKVNLSTPSASPVTVNYVTSDGTATAPSDYTSASSTLTIPAGQISGTISIPVNGDSLPEADETFNVTLSSPSGGVLAPNGSAAVGTIVNDDADVTLPATNVTSQVQVYRSSLTRNRTTGRWVLSLVIQNKGASLDGPLSLVLDGLTPTASLYNPDGTTSRTTPAGSPYRKLALPGVSGLKPDGVFAAGTTISLTIEFTNPTNGATDFTPRILQGPAGSL